jgi:hypothetical protein
VKGADFDFTHLNLPHAKSRPFESSWAVHCAPFARTAKSAAPAKDESRKDYLNVVVLSVSPCVNTDAADGGSPANENVARSVEGVDADVDRWD